MDTSPRPNRILYPLQTDPENSGNTQVPSPCVRNCCLDENEVCIGCGRHIDEILVGQQSAGKEKEKIIAFAKLRLKERAERYRTPDS